MAERRNGGVYTDSVVNGTLRHFVIIGADFSGAQDADGKPVYGSAASIIFNAISTRAIVAIMNPISVIDHGMSFALETGRSAWTVQELQDMLTSLGNDVGVDSIDLTSVTIKEVPYDFTQGGDPLKFTDLLDTPSNYPALSAGQIVTIRSTEDGLEFTTAVSADYIYISTTPFMTSIGNKYIIGISGVVLLPDYTTAVIGDSLEFTKTAQSTPLIRSFDGIQVIGTGIGDDVEILYDVNNELIFTFNGVSWALTH